MTQTLRVHLLGLEKKPFGTGCPGMCWDISRLSEEFEKKRCCVQFVIITCGPYIERSPLTDGNEKILAKLMQDNSVA